MLNKNSHENGPLVSVIIAVRNAAATLPHCIDSFIKQTYQNKELIIIDGGSTDGSVEIIRKNAKQITYWESAPDRGIYHAWNKALHRVKGEWICFLGADDYFWGDKAIEQIVPYLKNASPMTKIVYAKVAVVDNEGAILLMSGSPWEKIKNRFFSLMKICHQGVFHHRTLFECHGLFNENFRMAGEYELLLRELTKNDPLFVPNVILSAMRHGGISSNTQNSFHLLKEMLYARKLHFSRFPSIYWAVSFVKVFARMVLIEIFGDERTKRLIFALHRIGQK